MDIQITSRAIEKLRQIAEKEGVDLQSTLLRIAVIPGGCSGLTYDLGWDTVQQPGDVTGALNDFNLVADERSYLYFEGSELDFTDGLEGKGFHFSNPQAIRTCACGESFGL